MKKATTSILILMATLFAACEDVVQVDLNTAAPKLVVEAAINWNKGTAGDIQSIKLSTTTDYFSNTIPTVSGAIITITDSANTVYNFAESQTKGTYSCTNFKPVLNETYTLSIVSNGQTYTAVETLKPVAAITKIVQNDQGGFSGDEIEIKTYFNDPDNTDNYYLYKYIDPTQLTAIYYPDEDTFYQGNEFFSIYRGEKLKSGDTLVINHLGISKTYYNYLNVILSISGNSNGGPFQSPPATVRGNIINKTNFDNYALGYFSLSEVDFRTYIIN